MMITQLSLYSLESQSCDDIIWLERYMSQYTFDHRGLLVEKVHQIRAFVANG